MKIVKCQKTTFVYKVGGIEYQTFEDAKVAIIEDFIRIKNFTRGETYPVEKVAEFICNYSHELLKLMNSLEQQYENN